MMSILAATDLEWKLRCQLKADLVGADADGDAALAGLCRSCLAGDPEAVKYYRANYCGPDLGGPDWASIEGA